MPRLYLSSIPLVLLVLTRSDQAPQNEQPSARRLRRTTEPHLDQIRSPLMEVFARLPPNLRPPSTHNPRTKRTPDDPHDPKPEPQNLVSSLPASLPIRGPIYKTYPVKEFDVVDIDDPDDPRRRRTDSSSTNAEDSPQRDKRTFLEETSGETTTPLPFWKRKKETPPFVTGRAGSVQTGSGYTPAQHRSGENSRESHSLKNLDKTLQSNEISRSNQDNYYSSTNRRTYGRQYDAPPTSTPKSVYDTIDYNAKRNTESARPEFPRNHDDKKEPPRETTPHTHDHYTNRHPYNPPPWIYDRPYYQPAYPYPADILTRGVEYYHRTYDPTTGRLIYYANLPEQARSHDYRFFDPINRTFYLNARTHPFDPYYRNYLPPFDYRFINGYAPPADYVSTARTASQPYSYPHQERDKFPRDARFVGAFDSPNRSKDASRNKTYIIYDADDSRSHFSRPHHPHENNRLAYTPAPASVPSSPQRPHPPFKHFPFPPPPPDFFPNRNAFHSGAPGPNWAFAHRTLPPLTDSTSSSRPLHSPEVQLPLTASNRGDFDISNKS